MVLLCTMYVKPSVGSLSAHTTQTIARTNMALRWNVLRVYTKDSVRFDDLVRLHIVVVVVVAVIFLLFAIFGCPVSPTYNFSNCGGYILIYKWGSRRLD